VGPSYGKMTAGHLLLFVYLWDSLLENISVESDV